MRDKGIDKFIDYLDSLEEMITLFKGFKLSTEIMGDLIIDEEQAELANAYLNQIQTEWSKSFIQLLETGVTWLKNNEELKE